MSHNLNKVNIIKPGRDGDFSVALNSLSDVNIDSPTAGQVLKWVSSAWVAASPASSIFTSGGYAAGFSKGGGSSGGSYTTTGSLDSYRTHTSENWSEANADNSRYEFGGVSITRGTHGGATPTQVRFSKITVDTGRYLLFATTRSPISSSSNYIEWQWLNTSNDQPLGPKWRQYGSTADGVGYGIGYVHCSSGSITCDIRVVSNTGGGDTSRAYGDILAAIQIG